MAIGEHRPLSSVGWLARLFELRAPFPGDTYTVNVGALSHRAGAPFTTRHARQPARRPRPRGTRHQFVLGPFDRPIRFAVLRPLREHAAAVAGREVPADAARRRARNDACWNCCRSKARVRARVRRPASRPSRSPRAGHPPAQHRASPARRPAAATGRTPAGISARNGRAAISASRSAKTELAARAGEQARPHDDQRRQTQRGEVAFGLALDAVVEHAACRIGAERR